MTDEEIALFGALDKLGVWMTLEPGPAATRQALIDAFYRLVTATMDALDERLGRMPIGPVDFEELVTEAEWRRESANRREASRAKHGHLPAASGAAS